MPKKFDISGTLIVPTDWDEERVKIFLRSCLCVDEELAGFTVVSHPEPDKENVV